MIKKLLPIIIIICSLFFLISCGGDPGPNADSTGEIARYTISGMITLPDVVSGSDYRVFAQKSLTGFTLAQYIEGTCGADNFIEFSLRIPGDDYYIVIIVDNDGSGFSSYSLGDYVGYYGSTFPSHPTETLKVDSDKSGIDIDSSFINVAMSVYFPPFNAYSNKDMVLVFDTDDDITNGSIVHHVMQLPYIISPNTYSFLSSVPEGSYYSYAFVDINGSGTALPGAGDRMGFYNEDADAESNVYNCPIAANVDVPALGTHLFGSSTATIYLSAYNRDMTQPTDINVVKDEQSIGSGESGHNYGYGAVATVSEPVVFTIENMGWDEDLVISSISIDDESNYQLDESLTSSTIASGDSTTFAVSFSPESAGEKSAVVTIESNDPDESAFTFTVTGRVTEQEINIKKIYTTISDGSVLSMGRVSADSTTPLTFVIENTGGDYLTISDISLDDETNFEIDDSGTESTITPGGDTSFIISSNPQGYGAISTIVTVTSNDSDESTYSFEIEAISQLETVVDSNSEGMNFAKTNSMAMNNDGDLFISYYNDVEMALYLAKSTDGGESWSLQLIDSSSEDVGQVSTIKIIGQKIYIAYCDNENHNLKIAISEDGGETFVCSNVGSNYVSSFPKTSMVVVPDQSDGDNIYISCGNYGDVLFAKSTNGGSSWTIKDLKPDELDNDSVRSTALGISNSGHLYYSFSYDFFPAELWFMKSEDDGENWTAEKMVMNEAGSPAMVISDTGRIHFICTSDGDVFYLMSDDGGSSWSEKVFIDDGKDPSFVIDGNNFYISYHSYQYNDPLSVARSTDGGNSWTKINLDDSYLHGYNYSLVIDNDDNVNISYPADDGDALKFIKISGSELDF